MGKGRVVVSHHAISILNRNVGSLLGKDLMGAFINVKLFLKKKKKQKKKHSKPRI